MFVINKFLLIAAKRVQMIKVMCGESRKRCGFQFVLKLPNRARRHKNPPGNGVCRPAWENRLTVSALMTPTNKPTFAGAL
jgi:hypothetical protein